MITADVMKNLQKMAEARLNPSVRLTAAKPSPTIPGSVGAWAEALKQRKYIQMKLR